jgi:hypothetical protein
MTLHRIIYLADSYPIIPPHEPHQFEVLWILICAMPLKDIHAQIYVAHKARNLEREGAHYPNQETSTRHMQTHENGAALTLNEITTPRKKNTHTHTLRMGEYIVLDSKHCHLARPNHSTLPAFLYVDMTNTIYFLCLINTLRPCCIGMNQPGIQGLE